MTKREFPLQASSASVRVAREAVARFAVDLGFAPSMIELIRLAVSELVTNALVHGAAPFRLRMESDPERLRVTVSDASAREPSPTRAAITDLQGRGLSILERVADDHGWSPQPDGKTVWFSVLRHRR